MELREIAQRIGKARENLRLLSEHLPADHPGRVHRGEADNELWDLENLLLRAIRQEKASKVVAAESAEWLKQAIDAMRTTPRPTLIDFATPIQAATLKACPSIPLADLPAGTKVTIELPQAKP